MKALCLPAILFFCAAAGAGEEVTKAQAKKHARELRVLVKQRRPDAVKEFIERMVRLDSPLVAHLVPPAATVLPSKSNYEAALEGIAGLENGAAVARLAEILDKKVDPKQKVLILEAFARRDDPASLEAIVSQLKSEALHIRLTAIYGAVKRKAKEAVTPLIDILEQRGENRDRVWLDAYLGLITLTGQKFDTVEDWRKFWDGARETFDPASVGKEAEGKTAVEAIDIKATKDSVKFFGKEIFSHNLIFVIDISLSMLMYDENDEFEGKKAETERQRLRRAKQQLISALDKLPKHAQFNIIAYSGTVEPWQKRMQPASKKSIKVAQRFVQKLEAKPATATDDAMELAFKDQSVDTIVLLSDGAPIKPDKKSPREAIDEDVLIPKILKFAENMNAGRRIKIHTFGFEGTGTWPEIIPGVGRRDRMPPTDPERIKKAIAFLQQLAQDHDGSYQAID